VVSDQRLAFSYPADAISEMMLGLVAAERSVEAASIDRTVQSDIEDKLARAVKLDREHQAVTKQVQLHLHGTSAARPAVPDFDSRSARYVLVLSD